MIEICDLTLRYGEKMVLEHFDLHVSPGQHIALMGPSGCGKTSLLRIIAGLSAPASGTVSVSGRAAYVFQEPRLFPWMTALENIRVVLPNSEHAATDAKNWLVRSGLSDSADKYPAQLSGGMRQRIAICRALAAKSDLLLLDEPLKGLDPALHDEITALIQEYSTNKTLLLVTHDLAEAASLTDTVYAYRDHRFNIA